MDEQWIEFYDSYFVSNLGRIRRKGGYNASPDGYKYLKPWVNATKQRPVVAIKGQADSSKTFYVDKLVIENFLRKPNRGERIRHINGDQLDSRLCNLEYYRNEREPYKTKNGYIRVHDFDHPNSDSEGWLAEHRYVMSKKLKRPLFDFENVHHINGKRDDNRPENLELWVSKQPKGQRPEDLVQYAREILELYDEDKNSP